MFHKTSFKNDEIELIIHLPTIADTNRIQKLYQGNFFSNEVLLNILKKTT
jgi:hypothetical protein